MRNPVLRSPDPGPDLTPGLEPVVSAESRVLILGSLPSQASIEAQQYYGNVRNAFWTVMGKLAGAGPELPYGMRLQRLHLAGIGLWDVLAAAVRPGSLDSRIDLTTARTNDFGALLDDCPSVRCIGFNGKTAGRLFRADPDAMLAVDLHRVSLVDLPSTSPAHAAMTAEAKCRRWFELIACHLDNQ